MGDGQAECFHCETHWDKSTVCEMHRLDVLAMERDALRSTTTGLVVTAGGAEPYEVVAFAFSAGGERWKRLVKQYSGECPRPVRHRKRKEFAWSSLKDGPNNTQDVQQPVNDPNVSFRITISADVPVTAFDAAVDAVMSKVAVPGELPDVAQAAGNGVADQNNAFTGLPNLEGCLADDSVVREVKSPPDPRSARLGTRSPACSPAGPTSSPARSPAGSPGTVGQSSSMKADDDPNEEEAGTATLGEAAAAAGCVHLDLEFDRDQHHQLDDVDLDQILDLAVDLAPGPARSPAAAAAAAAASGSATPAAAMCRHYLAGRCNTHGRCKFSHGSAR